MTSTQHIARIVFPRKVFHKNQTKWSQIHNNSSCRRGWRISVWLWPKEWSLAETSVFVPAVEDFKCKEKLVVERKKPPSFVVADNLNQPSDEVPLHFENPLSDKVDVILPSNEVNNSSASNEIEENALSNIVAAKQSWMTFTGISLQISLPITSPGMNLTGIFFQRSLLVTGPQMLLRSFLQRRLTRNSP